MTKEPAALSEQEETAIQRVLEEPRVSLMKLGSDPSVKIAQGLAAQEGRTAEQEKQLQKTLNLVKQRWGVELEKIPTLTIRLQEVITLQSQQGEAR